MVICIYGAASDKIKDDYKKECYDLALILAKSGHSLVYGAGSSGMMGASARGFKDGGGKVHGVIPTFFEENGFEKIFYDADRITRTKTMAERKTIMENECDAFIVTPGGMGTMEEFFEALTLKQLGRHKKAIVIYNMFGYYDKLEELILDMIEKGFVNKECLKLFAILKEKQEIVEYLNAYSAGSVTWDLLKK